MMKIKHVNDVKERQISYGPKRYNCIPTSVALVMEACLFLSQFFFQLR